MLEDFFSNIYARRFFALMIDMASALGVALIIEYLLIQIGYDTLSGTVPFTLAVICLIFKDLIFAKGSLGKHLLKLELVVNQGSLTFVKRITRNLPLIILPLEMLATLVMKGRRIGDMLSGTEVISDTPDGQHIDDGESF